MTTRQAILDDSAPPRVVTVNLWDHPVGLPCPDWVQVGHAHFGGDQWGEHPQDTQRRLTDAVQRHLDATAQARGYDSILSAATYATSSVPRFAAEGQAAVTGRDAAWAAAFGVLEQVLAGQRAVPTEAELLAELPPIPWPAGGL